MTTPALDALVRSLVSEFSGRPRGAHIAELLGGYARTERDWRTFALFEDDQYTRNLVALDRRFELMILCWKAGQESTIHNHEGQDCWMAVLEGEIEEVRFPMPEADASPGPLAAKGSVIYGAGQVGFIRDEMGLHLVRPAPASRAAGVTLHLYSSPYDECNCYCPETGRVTRKKLGHYSVRGQRLAVAQAGTQ